MKLAFLTLAAATDLQPEELINIPISPDNGKVSDSNLVASGVTLYKEWELSVDLKMRTNKIWEWSNILALQVNHEDADDNLWHGIYGDRIPAVFMHGGKNTLHVCNSVNGNWNHCWNSGDLGTDWFNLKIVQRPEMLIGMPNPFVHKTHTSNTEYNYQVVFDDADQYETFYIDADFNNDVHIGFSNSQAHDGKKIEIVIGGWAGKQSVIRSGNQTPYSGHVKKLHTKGEFDTFKHNLQVTVADGIVQVFNGDEQPFMEWKSSSIKKSELTNLLVSGGWNGFGTWKIDAQIALPPPPKSDKIIYEILIDDEVMYSTENEQPKVWSNVRAEIANGIKASKGVYKNFSLNTVKPPRPYQPVENRITKLQAHFAEILSDSNLREAAQTKYATKFNSATDDLVLFYQILRDHEKHPCDFPPTWKEEEVDEVDRYNRDDPCKAISQMVTGARKWGEIFVHNCKREEQGRDPYNLLDRVMTKVNKVGDKVKAKMQC